MLFTRCPDCLTSFRITADVLRKADGQVRCGQCATVFSAYAELRGENRSEDGLADGGMPAEPIADSLSETDEVFALEEDVPVEPPLEEEVPAEFSLEEDEAPQDRTSAGSDLHERPLLDTPAENENNAEETEGQHDQTTSPEEPSLEFNLPKDEWTSFFEHVEDHPLADGLPQGGGSAQLAMDDSSPGKGSDSVIGDIVVKEVIVDPDRQTEDTLAGDGTEDGMTRVIDAPESDEAAAQLLEDGSLAPELSPETSTSLEEIISPEHVHATLSEVEVADTEPPEIDRIHKELHGPQASTSRRWLVGSVFLGVLFVLQSVHHFRAPLASQPVVGPLLLLAYSTAGEDVVADADLAQYEIMDWVATANADTENQGSLQIKARIHNRGPRDQPYPSVHLELKDRWETTVGSRVFTAAEYLPDDVNHERIMAAGSTTPASLEVVDPGQDAYGFELDICVELNSGELQCASDTVFQ